jgi:hypothetical protein
MMTDAREDVSTSEATITRHRPPPLQLGDGTTKEGNTGNENGYHTATTQSAPEKIVEDGRLFVSYMGRTLNIDLVTQQKAFVLFDKVLQCSTLSQLLETNVSSNYILKSTNF